MEALGCLFHIIMYTKLKFLCPVTMPLMCYVVCVFISIVCVNINVSKLKKDFNAFERHDPTEEKTIQMLNDR